MEWRIAAVEFGEWKLGKSDFNGIKCVRDRVFGEEMGLASGEIYDMLDEYSAHLLWLDDERAPIGAVRMYPSENHSIRIDKLCVVPEHRGKHTGELMLRMLIERTERMGKKLLTAYVPEGLRGYFARLGFSEADEVRDAGGSVSYKMTIYNDAAQPHCCCGHEHH